MILLFLGYFLVSVAIVLYIYLGVRLAKLWLKENRKSLKDLNINWDRIPLMYNYVVLDGDGFILLFRVFLNRLLMIYEFITRDKLVSIWVQSLVTRVRVLPGLMKYFYQLY